MKGRRYRVITIALLASLLCHFALLIWLPTDTVDPAPRTALELRLVASSAQTRIADPETADSAPVEPLASAGLRPPQLVSKPVSDPAVPTPALTQEPRMAQAEPPAEQAAARSPQPPVRPVSDSTQSARADATTEATNGLRLAIRQRLARFLNYPPAARRRAIEGDPVVLFVIARNGALLHHELALSSGSRHLDRAALKLVADAAPYPGFPPDLKLAQLEIRIPIEYRLRASPST